MEMVAAFGSQPPWSGWLEWGWMDGWTERDYWMGWNGRWRTLAGDFDRVAYFYGLLVVEGFLCPFSEVGIGGELRSGHGWECSFGW